MSVYEAGLFFKPSKERERGENGLKILYIYHDSMSRSLSRWTCEPRSFFSFRYQVQLGGKKTLRELYFLTVFGPP
jgi:hypothetical protein